MSVFEGIEEISPETATGSNHAYFEAGVYKVTIKDIFIHKKRIGTGRLFIAETIVETSTNDEIESGEQRNWVVSLELPNSLPRIKAFIGAAYGYDARKDYNLLQKNITQKVCDAVVSSNNPIAGKSVSLTCINKTSQAGKDFLMHQWTPNNIESAEEEISV